MGKQAWQTGTLALSLALGMGAARAATRAAAPPGATSARRGRTPTSSTWRPS